MTVPSGTAKPVRSAVDRAVPISCHVGSRLAGGHYITSQRGKGLVAGSGDQEVAGEGSRGDRRADFVKGVLIVNEASEDLYVPVRVCPAKSPVPTRLMLNALR